MSQKSEKTSEISEERRIQLLFSTEHKTQYKYPVEEGVFVYKHERKVDDSYDSTTETCVADTHEKSLAYLKELDLTTARDVVQMLEENRTVSFRVHHNIIHEKEATHQQIAWFEDREKSWFGKSLADMPPLTDEEAAIKTWMPLAMSVHRERIVQTVMVNGKPERRRTWVTITRHPNGKRTEVADPEYYVD